MSERKYYCVCESNCKFETMTREQILAAIMQAVETGSVGDVDTGFVTKLKETNSGSYITFWVGTRAQYEAIDPKDPNCLYIISNDTTTEDIWNTFAAMQADIDTAIKLCTNRAPLELVTSKNRVFSTMKELDEYLQEVVAGMSLYAVKIISCRSLIDNENIGAQITIHQGADYDFGTNVHVLFQTADGRAMQRFAWRKGAESQLNWEAWEYINPPMKDGVEYRTAERHNGKPVYVWTGSMAMGAGGETATQTITTDVTDDVKILSIDAVVSNAGNNYPWSPLPFFSISGSVAAVCDVTTEWVGGKQTLLANVHSIEAMTGYTAAVTVKYTK